MILNQNRQEPGEHRCGPKYWIEKKFQEKIINYVKSGFFQNNSFDTIQKYNGNDMNEANHKEQFTKLIITVFIFFNDKQ